MIVLDDVGFADLSCYGGAVETPNIDALARTGLRYNSFHTTALCSPTRACLLTGRNHHSVGMGYLPEAASPETGYSGVITSSVATLPRLLRDTGYNTFAVGKWHLTPASETSQAGPFFRWPLGMGFDRFYGFLRGATSQWTPDLVIDNTYVDPPASPFDGYHLTEDLVGQAVRLVKDQQASTERPFFLYFATGAMHDPHHVASPWVEPYRGRFDQGWEELRRQIFVRQEEYDIVPERTTLTSRPSWVRAWDELPLRERRLFARQMEVYAGFLSHTDAQVGRLIGLLETIGTLDNTLIMVLSDNGASADAGPFGASGLSVQDVDSMVAQADELGGHRSWNHYAWGWAWAGNTPFKLWKHYAWLGGVRSPLIVSWPAGIPKERRGEIRRQFCHAVDIMPTILDAARLDISEKIGSIPQRPIDGASFVPTFADPRCASPRSTQYFEIEGSRAIYHNGWKATTDHVASYRHLIAGSTDFGVDRWSLHNLEEDFSEAHDLAGLHTEKLHEIIALWHREAGSNTVLPLNDLPFAERVAAHAVRSDRAQRRAYWPGGGPITTPSLAAGFSMTAGVEIKEDVDGPLPEGVVCAQGDWNAGWACYVVNGLTGFAFNFNRGVQRLLGDKPLSPGYHRLTVALSPDPADRWTAEASVDDSSLGVAEIALSQPLAHWLSLYARLLVGRDRGFPVCDDYRPPFPFNHRIQRVVLEAPC